MLSDMFQLVFPPLNDALWFDQLYPDDIRILGIYTVFADDTLAPAATVASEAARTPGETDSASCRISSPVSGRALGSRSPGRTGRTGSAIPICRPSAKRAARTEVSP